MNAMLQDLMSHTPVVTDGAWATQLQVAGLPIGACPDAWNLRHPDRVEAVARAYVQAGSQIVLTNTFGANRIALARHGLEDQVVAINRAGVTASRRAAGTTARVFASMGPTGAMLATGEVSEAEVRAAFSEQARTLAGAGADAIVIETMTELAEVELAVAAARETGLPAVACMTFSSGKEGDQTMRDVTPEQAAEALSAAGAEVIGANCGNGAAPLLPICVRLRAATPLPLWMKPNAGLPELPSAGSGPITYRTTPEEFAVDAVALVKAGAAFIGGCCGTGPAFMRALVKALGSEAS